MEDEKLKDLFKQATKERSHYYVGSVVREALEEIDRLNKELKELKNSYLGYSPDQIIGLVKERTILGKRAILSEESSGRLTKENYEKRVEELEDALRHNKEAQAVYLSASKEIERLTKENEKLCYDWSVALKENEELKAKLKVAVHGLQSISKINCEGCITCCGCDSTEEAQEALSKIGEAK